MDDYKYKYILAIAEHKSFSKAADSLFISQPYLSKVVSSIEKELGMQLFDRKHAPLSVTAAGECYIDYIKTVLHAQQQLRARLSDIGRNSRGTIHLGIGSTHCSYIIPDVFQRFRELYPYISINFSECSNKTMIEHIENGILDFALYTSPEVPPGLDSQIIKEERLLLVFPPNYPVKEIFPRIIPASIRTLEPQDIKKLADEQFIALTEHQGIGQFLRRIFDQYNISPHVVYEVKNVETAYRLAAAGFGITLVPEICLRFCTFKVEPHYFQIENPPLARKVVMVYKRGKRLSLPEKMLCDIIREIA